MGMYTEIFFRAEVDQEAYTTLSQLRGVSTEYSAFKDKMDWPKHSFFTLGRVYWMLNAGSFYFVPKATFDAFHEGPSNSYYVTFRTDLKNYEGEIEAFFDWIMPHVKTTGFVGYSLYEEDRVPTCWFKEDGNDRAGS